MTLAASHSRVGSVIDHKYEVVRLLGAGGMGEVYEARHRQIERSVALKFLHPDALHDPELSARFTNEARAAGMLRHENIAAVYDTGVTQDGAQYLVMELIDGSDCAELLVSAGKLPAARAVDIIVQVCRGLAVAHARGIVHRDLKPANLFLARRADGSDLIKVLDFGIARLRPGIGAARAAQTQAAMGTLFYMAPEQIEGARDMDARVDVYALGVVLYELLSGQKPHVGDTPLKTLHLILTEEPPAIAKLVPGLAPSLCEVIARAMMKHREDRFANVAELAQALQAVALSAATLPTATTRALLKHAPTLPDKTLITQPPDTTGNPIELVAAPALHERALSTRTKRWAVALLTAAALVTLALAVLAPGPTPAPVFPAAKSAETRSNNWPLTAASRTENAALKPETDRPNQAASATHAAPPGTKPVPTARRVERRATRSTSLPSASPLAHVVERVAPSSETSSTSHATQTPPSPATPAPTRETPAAGGERLHIDHESPFR